MSSSSPPGSAPAVTSTIRELPSPGAGRHPPSVPRSSTGSRSLWPRTAGGSARAPTMGRRAALSRRCSPDPSPSPSAIYRGFSALRRSIHSLGYVAVMNSIVSAQRSMVPIDTCVAGVQHSAFLQQGSYITSGVYLKPQQLDGLFQYLSAVFATDLQSRSFLQLLRPVGVDFRAS